MGILKWTYTSWIGSKLRASNMGKQSPASLPSGVTWRPLTFHSWFSNTVLSVFSDATSRFGPAYLQTPAGPARQHRLRVTAGEIPNLPGSGRLVRKVPGPNRMQVRRIRFGLVYHWRLRLRQAGVQWDGGCSTGEAGRVHVGQRRRLGLLRREPSGWTQFAGEGGGERRIRRVRFGGLCGGPELAVPVRAEGGQRRGLQERVRGVWERGILL
ncbi:unnamed protein product [Thlaspi arvense]|uniref:Uncharacterized protein n=1 Tax=Thlaspi arvense TaxID=13288 RepID=A0AAU9RHJ0_THLAR|nr:unnamed protein product [Thlaspi arvense]